MESSRPTLFSDLRDHNISWKDAVVALRLAEEIERIDKIVFDTSPSITIATYQHPFEAPAQYCQDDTQRWYEIYAPRLSHSVKSECRSQKVGFPRIIFQIATHEVRHKMQYSISGFRLFHLAAKVRDPLLQEVLTYAAGVIEEGKVMAREQHWEEALIQRRWSEYEYDAVVLSLWSTTISHSASDNELKKLLWMQPLE